MKIKARMMGDRMNINNMLLSPTNLQLTTKVYCKQFPVKKSVGIMTILDDFEEKDNCFHVVLKNSKEQELGRGSKFRTHYLTLEREGIVIYNVNDITFESKDDFYIVELWNEDEILDRYKLECCAEIYDVYMNLLPKGRVSLI